MHSNAMNRNPVPHETRSHSSSPAVGLYVHVPFCRTRCTYCDFNTYAGLGHLMPTYVAAVCREIEAATRLRRSPTVSTIYVGGGTPSLLPSALVADLLDATRDAFPLSICPEITLEANPGTVTPAYLRSLRSLGIGRLSLGAQSAHADELQMLGRGHTWADARDTVESARTAGFANVSLDLIFGLPGQTVLQWEETLAAALRLEPEHLSLYGLTLEDGTVLADEVARNVHPAPDEEHGAEMYELAETVLAEAGFFHYEISNWARIQGQGQEWSSRSSSWWPASDAGVFKPEISEEISAYVCRHNLIYWRNQPWLGVGAGPHSWYGGQRWANVTHPQRYVTAWEKEGTRATPCSVPTGNVEEIDERLEMGETMMLGLRLAEGVSTHRFDRRFGEPLGEVFGTELDDLHRLGLLGWDGSVARLTQRGRLLGNLVFARFV